MPTPGGHKTVQARILECAEAIGWTIVSREGAEQRRGFDPEVPPADRAKNRSLFFDDLLDAKVREFNPRCAEAEGALLGQFRHLHTDIYGNPPSPMGYGGTGWEFVEHLRNPPSPKGYGGTGRGKFFDHEEKRERDLILIDYDDLNATAARSNVYEVTEEWAFHNGHYGTREDVAFLINGIPVLVIECKNANKDEAIALGVDQIRRYHRETPELFVSQQLFTATDAIGFSYGVSWNTVRRNIFTDLGITAGTCAPGARILIWSGLMAPRFSRHFCGFPDTKARICRENGFSATDPVFFRERDGQGRGCGDDCGAGSGAVDRGGGDDGAVELARWRHSALSSAPRGNSARGNGIGDRRFGARGDWWAIGQVCPVGGLWPAPG